MKAKLYDVDDVVRTYYDDALKAIVVEWTHFHPDHVRPCIELQLECVKSQDVKTVIVDSAGAKGAPSTADQKWFGEKLFPAYIEAGLEAIITTVSESALVKTATKAYAKSGEQAGIDMIDAADFDAAMAAARSYL